MKYKIILASNSPRRKELLAGLDFPFEVRVMQGIDESFPDTLNAYDTALYIACKKADAYQSLLEEGDDNLLVLTADTVVIAPSDGFLNDQECKGVILGKPHDAEEAYSMLRMLSGKTHHVVTGVCLTTRELQRQFSVVTEVSFKKLELLCKSLQTLRQGWCLRHPGMDRLRGMCGSQGQLFQCDGTACAAHL